MSLVSQFHKKRFTTKSSYATCHSFSGHASNPCNNISRANAGPAAVRDNYNLKSYKYACITTYQPDTKSNPNPNPNPNPTTKQHAIVNIQH